MEQSQSQEMEKLVENAKAKFVELDTEYKNFSDLKEDLKNKAGSIKLFNTRAEKGVLNIENLVTSTQKTATEIDVSADKIQKIYSELEGYSKKFSDLKSKIDDPNYGLESSLRLSQETKEKIGQKYEEVIKAQGQIETAKEASDGYKTEIEKIQTEIEGYKKSIADTLKLITAAGLTVSFAKRKGLIQKRSTKWSWLNLAATLILGIAVLFIYYLNTNGDSKDWHLWYRYLFTSPLIYLVYYCAKNHALERDLEEKYAFKEVLSTSLESYVKLLHDKYPHKIDDLFTFTLRTIGTIYKEPYIEKKQRTKIYFGFKNIVNGGVELDQADKKTGSDKVGEQAV